MIRGRDFSEKKSSVNSLKRHPQSTMECQRSLSLRTCRESSAYLLSHCTSTSGREVNHGSSTASLPADTLSQSLSYPSASAAASSSPGTFTAWSCTWPSLYSFVIVRKFPRQTFTGVTEAATHAPSSRAATRSAFHMHRQAARRSSHALPRHPSSVARAKHCSGGSSSTGGGASGSTTSSSFGGSGAPFPPLPPFPASLAGAATSSTTGGGSRPASSASWRAMASARALRALGRASRSVTSPTMICSRARHRWEARRRAREARTS
mmetsp:Transcript_40647/g.129653  ORF Transcript_40647/g.129653 Transcript_40647/m.129653 type:complete len:265 (-) Transcript_40647:418-1212(-)